MALDKFQPYLFVSAGEQSNKYLTPTITNGIAQFQAQRAQSLTGLTVRIDPIQEGTGDPSPTNIRPISGRTGMTVTRAGKNLLANKKVMSGNSIYLGTDVIGSPYYNMRTITLPAGTYTLSVENADGSATNLYAAKTGVQEQFARATSAKSLTFTLSETTDCYFWVYKASYSTVGVGAITQFQLELSSTATAYESYTAQTYSVTWQTEAGTVYGGTLDVVSGVLTVTHAAVDMGTLTYAYDANIPRFHTSALQNMIAIPADITIATTAITSMYKAVAFYELYSIRGENGTFAVSSGGTISFINTEYTDAGSFKTAMAGQTLCYELATPQTYQLDPEQIMTVPGFNLVYSDAGPVIDIKF